MDRAYALLEIKSIDAERRRFSGIASTPELDRHGDIVDPAGVTYRDTIPLLLHHDQSKPIGTARLSRLPDGRIAFDAEVPIIEEAGTLRDRVDEAWQSIKAGLMRGVSIGHDPIAAGIRYLRDGARKISKTEICELSLVTIPANTNATILAIKSFAQPARRGTAMRLTTGEHIQNLENKRAALAGRMDTIMSAGAEENRTLNPDEATEYDDLTLEIKALDADLGRWREQEKINAKAAAPVIVPGLQTKTANPVISVRPNVPLGTQFVRLACAQLVCKGNMSEAAEYAKRWNDSTPEVALALKAAVTPGTTTDPAWAGPLVMPSISSDFLELLRAATILGKIPGLRQTPFNTRVPSQTAGGTYQWVGEGKPKPVTALAFSSTTLGFAKAAGIIALTDELVRLSNPSAEALCRNDMIEGIARFLDQQFIDPAVAAVANVHPASITNGAPTATATLNPLADILGLINHFAVNNIDVKGLTFIMSPSNALALSFRSNLDGSAQFPGIGLDGGTYRGITFVTSNTAGSNVIALQPKLILYADDGQVSIDASREASLQMDSAPMSPADATTVYFSLWQNNMIGLRAERWINWQRANANAVKYLTGAAYPAPSEAAPATEAA
jgi:HK97 family phage major capsid protein